MPVYDVKLPIRAEITIRIEAEDEPAAIERAAYSGDLQTLDNYVGHFFNFIEVDEDRAAEVYIAKKDEDQSCPTIKLSGIRRRPQPLPGRVIFMATPNGSAFPGMG